MEKSNKNELLPVQKLPDELFAEIAKFLPLKDIFCLLQTNKELFFRKKIKLEKPIENSFRSGQFENFSRLIIERLAEKKKKEIIEEIQEQIKESLKHPSARDYISFVFNKKLIELINRYSKTEKGQDLIDKAFNSLDEDSRIKFQAIDITLSSLNCENSNEKLKYFPNLEKANFPNLNFIDAQEQNYLKKYLERFDKSEKITIGY